MALFKYLRPVDNLPDPNGPLSTVIHPSVTAEVNRQVRAIEQQPKKRGEYSKHSTEEKAAIGKYAGENGVAAAVRYYKKTKGVILKELLVRDWKKAYLSEVAKRRSSVHVGEDLSVTELPEKRKGRPPLLGVKLDEQLQRLVEMRARGTAINSSILIGVGRGILMKSNKSLLHEYGGPIQLSKEWAKSVLRRMGYTKRRANLSQRYWWMILPTLKHNFCWILKHVLTLKTYHMSL